MILKRIGYSYNDLTIVPAVVSDIESRSECNPYTDSKKMLPIFTAPMASVVSEKNMDVFLECGITPVMPRNIPLDVRLEAVDNGRWAALSLHEFKDVFIFGKEMLLQPCRTYSVCVDIANGHMMKLYDVCADAKGIAKASGYSLEIMTGNIANPDTYRFICDRNAAFHEGVNVVDYIRVSIGSGAGCITSSNCGVHYPIASLIEECRSIASRYPSALRPKIVADGGIRNYDHVTKALALGADCVMIGSLFSQCMESAGFKTHRATSKNVPLRFPVERYRELNCDDKGMWKGFYTDEYIKSASSLWQPKADVKSIEQYEEDVRKYNEWMADLRKEKYIGTVEVKFFGMASADGQKSINGEKRRTSEGITKMLPVNTTLKKWTENMDSYLRTAMSYTGCRDLSSFIGNVNLIPNSEAEIMSVNK